MARLHNSTAPGPRLREGELIIRRRSGGPNRNSSIVGFIARVHTVISDITFISESGDKLFHDDFRKATEYERYEYERAKPRPRFVKELRGVMGGLISRDDLSRRTPGGNPVVDTGTVIVRMRKGKAGRRHVDSIGYITRIVRIHQNGDFIDEDSSEAHIGSFRLADGSETHKYIQSGGRVSNVSALKDITEMNYLAGTRGGYGHNLTYNPTTQASKSDRELASMMAMQAKMENDNIEREELLYNSLGNQPMRSSHRSPIAADVVGGMRNKPTPSMKIKAEKKIERTLPPPVVIPIGKKKIKRLI